MEKKPAMMHHNHTYRLLLFLASALLASATAVQAQSGQETITDIANFTSSSSGSPGGNGRESASGLTYDPANGLYYGVCAFGGAHGDGDVYSFNPATNAIVDVADFGGANGEDALGALLYDSVNGLFYGTASGGGASGDGDVFSFNPATSVITDVGDFTGAGIGGNGLAPSAGLIFGSGLGNNLFYGTAGAGGANGAGDVFSFNSALPASMSITDVGDFTSPATGTGGNGNQPDCTLVYDPTNGSAFYGTAYVGGAHGDGDVFSFNPTASASASITDVADFTGSNGGGPVGGLIYDGATSLYYGAASGGGADDVGDVYSFNPVTNALADVGDLTSAFDAATGTYAAGGSGASPLSGLVYDSANGLFYGTAFAGGADDYGDVFSFNPSLPGSTSVADAGDFTGSGARGNGSDPLAPLVFDATANLFYGAAAVGGANNDGDIYSLTPTAHGDFSTSISNPSVSPIAPTTAQNIMLSTSVSQNVLTTAPAPTGTVTFTITPTTGAAIAETATLTNGTATVTLPAGTLPAGTYSATAFYSGDANNNGSGPSSASPFRVSVPLNTTSTTVSAPSSATVGQNVTVTANVSPATATGTITFTFTPAVGNSIGSPMQTVAGGTATYTTNNLPYGSYTITASYSGDASDAASVSPGVPLLVLPNVLTTFPSGLQMVCLTKDYTSFAEALDNIGTPPAYDTYDGSNYVLSNSATEAAPAPGIGFWIDPSAALNIYDTGTYPNQTLNGNPVPILADRLTQGWNLIGDPFGTPLPLADLSTSGVTGLTNLNATGLLYGTIYTWGPTNTDAYTALNGTAAGAALQPFTGYWLYAFQGGETLTFGGAG